MLNKEPPSQDLKLDKEKIDKAESLLREHMLKVHEKANAKTVKKPPTKKKQPLLPPKEPTLEHEKESEPEKSQEEAKLER